MKNLTSFPLQGFEIKKYGIILSCISMGFLTYNKLMKPGVFHNIDEDKQSHILFIFVIIGLFIITFSKERVDDERVQQIRAKATQGAFTFLTGILISLSLVSILIPTGQIDSLQSLPLIAMLGLSFYLLSFYIGLLFDPKIIYNNETAYIKKNKFFFIYAAFMVIGMVLFLFLF